MTVHFMSLRHIESVTFRFPAQGMYTFYYYYKCASEKNTVKWPLETSWTCFFFVLDETSRLGVLFELERKEKRCQCKVLEEKKLGKSKKKYNREKKNVAPLSNSSTFFVTCVIFHSNSWRQPCKVSIIQVQREEGRFQRKIWKFRFWNET